MKRKIETTKWSTQQQAEDYAQKQSLQHSETCYVILSQGFYYGDESSFCRNNETIISSFTNGVKNKD